MRFLLAPAPLCYPRAVASKLSALLAVGSSLAALAVATPARADVSAWAFLGGGTLGWKQGDASTKTVGNDGTLGLNGTMTIEAGAGTSSEGRVIVGGLFRVQPIFKHGTDLAWLFRVCSPGFQAADWGFAVDVGPYLRPWQQLSGGFAGTVSLGLPLGFTIAAQTEVGTNKALSFGAVAGIDFLRLTVYRKTLLNWWQNPAPEWLKPRAATAQR